MSNINQDIGLNNQVFKIQDKIEQIKDRIFGSPLKMLLINCAMISCFLITFQGYVEWLVAFMFVPQTLFIFCLPKQFQCNPYMVRVKQLSVCLCAVWFCFVGYCIVTGYSFTGGAWL